MKTLRIAFFTLLILNAGISFCNVLEVSDTVQTNTLWDADTVHVLTNLVVPDNVTLTIAPGTQVLFSIHTGMKVKGTLIAVGTPSGSVVFSSYHKLGFDATNMNTSQGSWNGIVFNNLTDDPGAMDDNDSSRFSHCIFTHVKAIRYDGGALVLRKFSRITIDHTTFSNCSAYGGGILYSQQGDISVDNMVFTDNFCHYGASAIQAFQGNIAISNSRFSNNTSTLFGTVNMMGGTLTAYNCLFTYNRTLSPEGKGGALYASYGDARIYHCTFFGNRAEATGGALSVVGRGNTSVVNSIFWENGNAMGKQISLSNVTGSADIRYSTLQGGLQAVEEDGGNTTYSGSMEFIIDDYPEFADTLHADFSLLSSSSSINTGLTDSIVSTIPLDLAGNSRIYNDAADKPDIGAYEFQGSTASVSGIRSNISMWRKELQVNETDTILCIFENTGPTDFPITSFALENNSVFRIARIYSDSVLQAYEQDSVLLVVQPSAHGFYHDKLEVGNATGKGTIRLYAMCGLSGPVSGTFTKDNSPYYISGDLIVPHGETLVLEPGVTLCFNEDCGIVVQGSLQAKGLPGDSIRFTSDPGNENSSWKGVLLDNVQLGNDSSIFDYAIFENSFSASDGAALKIIKSYAFRISNCLFRENQSGYHGGILSIDRATGMRSKEIRNTSFIRNQTLTAVVKMDYSPVSFYNCNFSENKGRVLDYFDFDDPMFQYPVMIRKCSFTGNSYLYDGTAVYATYLSDNLLIDSCSFVRNTSGGTGGAIYTDSDLILKNSLFLENEARYGGAIHVRHYLRGGTTSGGGYYSGNYLVEGCRFISNKALYNGGACFESGGNLRYNNCLFYGNKAAQGGAVHSTQSNDPMGFLRVYFSTFINNSASADSSNDIFSSGDLTLRNCILWNGKGSNAVVDNSYEYNVYFSNLHDTSFTLSNANIHADPELTDTLNHNFTPKVTSPCVNTASFWGYSNSPKLDITGQPRIARPDMGAFEYRRFVTDIDTSYVTDSTCTLTIRKPADLEVLLLMREGTIYLEPVPSDSTSYSTSLHYGTGDTLTNGWYAMQSGADSVFAVSGLKTGRLYYVQCIVYGGLPGNERYVVGSGDWISFRTKTPGGALNTPPYLTGTIPDQEVRPGDVVLIKPSDYFADSTEWDTLVFQVGYSPSTATAEWINYNENTQTLHITPGTEQAGQEFTITLTGTDSYGEEASLSFTVRVTDPLYLPALADMDILVFPNPASDQLTIRLNEARPYRLVILNAEGRQMVQDEGHNSSICLATGHLPDGIYLLKLETDGETCHTTTIIIKK
jgi:predicted outer membrane repeat protein